MNTKFLVPYSAFRKQQLEIERLKGELQAARDAAGQPAGDTTPLALWIEIYESKHATAFQRTSERLERLKGEVITLTERLAGEKDKVRELRIRAESTADKQKKRLVQVLRRAWENGAYGSGMSLDMRDECVQLLLSEWDWVFPTTNESFCPTCAGNLAPGDSCQLCESLGRKPAKESEELWPPNMCAQGPRWLINNVCGSTTSNSTVDDAKVTCPDCLEKLKERK